MGGGEMGLPGTVKGGLNINHSKSSLSSLVVPWSLGRVVDAGGKGRAEGTQSWEALQVGEMDSGIDSGLFTSYGTTLRASSHGKHG